MGHHNAHWITSGLPNAGKIMIFDNGHGLTPAANYSSIEIIDPPVSSTGVYTATFALPAGGSVVELLGANAYRFLCDQYIRSAAAA